MVILQLVFNFIALGYCLLPLALFFFTFIVSRKHCYIMSPTSLVHKIALGMIPGVGDITARKLVSYAGSVEAIFSEPFRNLTKIPGVGETLAKTVAGHDYLDAAAREAEYVEKQRYQSVPLSR